MQKQVLIGLSLRPVVPKPVDSKPVVPKLQCASESPAGLVKLLGSTPTLSDLTGLDKVRTFVSGDADTAGLNTTL